MPEIIVVHGYVGSGKSTQCSRLASSGLDETRVQHVSAGNRLRGIRTGIELSEYSSYVNVPDAPSPLPDSVVEGVIFEAIDGDDSTLALVDGYPRHPQSIESFHAAIRKKHHRLLGTIALQVPENVSVGRIMARGKRDGEKVQGADLQEFAKHRYLLDIQTTSLAIAALSKITPVRFIDATEDVSTVYSRFVEEVKYLQQQNGKSSN